ncbi:STAS domain-containing protein [Catellatospora coxensis]|uniref:STAS domain-containing protein n=1 Tax=Catellatospora coxensis TaxID=310354 RepID=A0A8J3L2V7_9ACTN|nr:STAS domain-containing protein [Catellatospora coxensis]GIG05640.1 hypothetical protein Cco03nite_23400 [Catellatospora coxensis]
MDELSRASQTTQTVPLVEVQVCGDLDASSAPGVNDVLSEALALHPRQLVIDLAGCDVIDAAGILLLLDAHRRAIRDGGMVALRSPSARARRNLKLAKVDRVLQVISPDGDLTLGISPDSDARPGEVNR